MDDRRTTVAGYDLRAIALFAVAGAILGLAVAFVYIGVTFLSLLGVEWHWVWE